MHLKEIAVKHYAWVKRVGWNNKLILERLALVCSEVGEAVNECRGEHPTPALGHELADIVLRVCGIAEEEGIDIEQMVIEKMDINATRGSRGRIK